MIYYQLKIAWRNLIKDRQFTVLNILGLTAGLACAMLIYLWVQDELAMDRFNKNDADLYQLLEHRNTNGDAGISDESSGMLSETLAASSSQIQYAAALAPPEWFQRFTLSVKEKNLKAVGQYAGKDYFQVFTFPLLEGTAGAVLQDKNSIVISRELATKLFGTSTGLIGKKIRFQQQKDFFVSGVFENIPSHSSQQFDFVLSFEYLKDVQNWVTSWNNTGPHNFVRLKPGSDVNAFNRSIAGTVTQHSGDTTRIAFARRFSDMYLTAGFNHGSPTGGRIQYVKLFSLIAFFILAIACINFMNLSTAKASRRLKEVGIKKVVGAGRGQIILQFLTESVMLSFIAGLFGFGVAALLLPEFNFLTGKHMSFSLSPNIIWAISGIILFTGLAAGSYPAFYLSSFQPITTLKGKLKTSISELLSRKGLVVFQFTLSTLLIVGVIVIYQQIKFIQSTDPGYQKENVLRFDAEGRIQNNEPGFVEMIKKLPGVVNASYTFNNMVGRNYGTYGVDWPGKAPTENIYFEGFGGGYDLIGTMGMHMAAGRAFSKSFGGDTSNVILNETAVAVMHLKDPVGKTIQLYQKNAQIVGVVRDFHFESLHEPVKPSFMVVAKDSSPWYKIIVRLEAGHQKETIAGIQKLYESYNPGFPFSFNFVDALYQKQYETEEKVSVLSRYFAGLAIAISCLGLFGLAAFTAQQRQKEIGIRKVVGATAAQIVLLLSRDFLLLIALALLIAFPIAWWAMNGWLQAFAYRINFQPMIFVYAGAAVIVITLITISFQSVKAANMNPVKSLRSE